MSKTCTETLTHTERSDLFLTILRRLSDVFAFAGEETPLSRTDIITILETFMKIAFGRDSEPEEQSTMFVNLSGENTSHRIPYFRNGAHAGYIHYSIEPFSEDLPLASEHHRELTASLSTAIKNIARPSRMGANEKPAERTSPFQDNQPESHLVQPGSPTEQAILNSISSFIRDYGIHNKGTNDKVILDGVELIRKAFTHTGK